MKPIRGISVILRPLLIGLAAAAIGAGVAVYFSMQDNATGISYFFTAIVIAAGAVMIAGGIWQAIRLRIQQSILDKGTRIVMQYESHQCRYSTSRSALYRIRYTGTDADGKAVSYASPGEYRWEEVLAIKSAGQVDMMTYRGKYLLMQDLQALQDQYRAEIERLEGVYDRAMQEVQRMRESSDPAFAVRKKNTVVEKQKREQVKQTDLPSAKDDAERDEKKD